MSMEKKQFVTRALELHSLYAWDYNWIIFRLWTL